MYSHDLLRYVDPVTGWMPAPQLQKTASAILTELEEVGAFEATDSVKVILVLRLTFQALAPNGDIDQIMADIKLRYAKV